MSKGRGLTLLVSRDECGEPSDLLQAAVLIEVGELQRLDE